MSHLPPPLPKKHSSPQIRIIPYLKYGVAFMLVFIGAKLILSKVIHIESFVVCAVLCGTLFICMIGGWYANYLRHEPDYAEKVAESRASPVLQRTPLRESPDSLKKLTGSPRGDRSPVRGGRGVDI